MKTQIFSLMLSAAIFTTSPLFAMDAQEDERSIAVRTATASLTEEDVVHIKELATHHTPSKYYLGTLYETGHVLIEYDVYKAMTLYREGMEMSAAFKSGPCDLYFAAFYMLGTQYNTWGKYPQAAHWYCQAKNVAGQTHPLSSGIDRIIQDYKARGWIESEQ